MKTEKTPSEPVRLKDILEKTTKFFREKDYDSPRLDAELLISSALSLRRIDLYLKYDQPLAEAELNLCRELVRRRIKGEPVAYILGQKEFYGMSFSVDKDVLIPRPETELLVEAVLSHFKKRSRQSNEENIRILDLGCGSGCIGLSLAKLIEGSQVHLVDLSPEALAVAKKNAEQHGLLVRSEFSCEDAAMFSGAQALNSEQKFDVITANPPYISSDDQRVQKEVLEFEPHQALFSGQNGLAANFSWSKNTVKLLKPGAIMCFEFGIDQSEQVLKHFQELAVFSEISIIKDLSGIDRHIFAVRKDS